MRRLACLALALAGCAATTPSRSTMPPVRGVLAARGVSPELAVSGSRVALHAFGVSIELPSGWSLAARDRDHRKVVLVGPPAPQMTPVVAFAVEPVRPVYDAPGFDHELLVRAFGGRPVVEPRTWSGAFGAFGLRSQGVVHVGEGAQAFDAAVSAWYWDAGGTEWHVVFGAACPAVGAGACDALVTQVTDRLNGELGSR